MRKNVLIATATISLLSACREQVGENEAEVAAADQATPAPVVENTPAPPPPATREEALKLMHERHEGMEKIGKATKAIGAEIKKGDPNFGTIRTNADIINDLAKKSEHWFPAGTGPDVGKTRAKAEIWQKPEDFAAKDRDFRQAARAFTGSANSADINSIKPAFAVLGKTCKACHDSYRAEEKGHD
ncbi:MAG TPA: cytochrome c [Sphingomicrobium sp.]|nr:cytochrome c [Sphingomicrobium sp.]